ncbi:MAG: Gfo/Idh/MocA family oxidoreductase [Verrucomicrobiota bacterium]|nr:Gfo/Idh/MocA family oxidoreductase [Verrucomicrobiota bacterium]
MLIILAMIKLAIIGTGGMAHTHATEYSKIKGVKLVAACDVLADKAREYAAKFAIPHAFDDVGKMLETCDIDAVSIVAPDKFHSPLALQVIAAGKHVLCEKPLATCHADAVKMAEAAKKAGVINMVNFSYRNSSALQHLAKRVQAGDLGKIFHVQAHYLQSWLVGKDWGDWKTSPGWLWRLSTEHGSKGVLGDIGVHILDFASFPVGKIASVNCLLKTFDKAPENKVGEYKLDANDTAIITVNYEGGAVGAVQTTRLATGFHNSLLLQIHGEKGVFKIELDKSYGEYEQCLLLKDGKSGPWEPVKAPATPNMYERFIKSIKKGVNDQPDFDRGAAIQQALDACELSNKTGKTVVLK